MDGMADAEAGRRMGPGAGGPEGTPSDPGEGLLTFDEHLHVRRLAGRVAAILGLTRAAHDARSVHELLEASPRLDQEALAALMAACLAATLPGAEAETELCPPGAPGLRFALRRVTARSWSLGIQAVPAAPGTAGTDPLTGLADRPMFEARLSAALGRPLRRRAGCAVLLCELEGIRAINQMFGHATGEDVLRAAARRLQAAIRDADLVARLAGEEFAVLQGEVSDATHATALAQRLVHLLGRPYQIGGETLVVTPRIGVAVAPGDGEVAGQLMRRAAMARNETPAVGAGGFRRFSPEMDRRWQEARALEVALRRAVAEGDQFELHYQPQVVLPEGRLTGFEALIRWRHPDRGLLSPAAFLPVAETLGLMRRIGSWVLREACRTAAAWPAPLTVAVNIAPAQLEDGLLPEEVEAALREAGLPASRLEIEVTEGVLLATAESALRQLMCLRERGVRIAMDDFGTGHSSLTQLRVFPFDRLKIDRSFVQDLPRGGDAAAIVRAVAGLGRSLGIAVTAEGVETEEQLRDLQAEGCHAAQGYLFGRPVPAAMVPGVITELAGR